MARRERTTPTNATARGRLSVVGRLFTNPSPGTEKTTNLFTLKI
jgi:hypothetical protein